MRILTRFAIQRGQVVVTARSSVNYTTKVWSHVEGNVSLEDPGDLGAGAQAELRVDMRVFDAGDRLKNWKLKSDLDPERYPVATFRLERLENVRQGPPVLASAVGVLGWRGREVKVVATGSGEISQETLRAEAQFELDVRDLGVTPPKILMFKVEHVVSVRVSLEAASVVEKAPPSR